MIPITRNTGLKGHQQLCPPAQPSNTDREWGRPSVAVSVPIDLWVSSFLRWPGWLNALCEHWRAMRTQGYLQPPQHSCGDTAASVAAEPLCNFTSSQTQQEVQASSVKKPLSSSQHNKKNLLTFVCRAQHPVTHFYYGRSYTPPHSLHTVTTMPAKPRRPSSW